MDTREKILTPERALEIACDLRRQGIRYKAVSGYFDVLQSAMVADIARYAERDCRLFALVLEPERPLLPSRARAELAAALRVVDYVVSREGDAASFIRPLQPDEWMQAENAHGEMTEQLIEHVANRHQREQSH